MTIATTLLVVPASALALTSSTVRGDGSQPSPATALPVQVSPKHVDFGDPVKVTGVAPAIAPGGRVVLQAQYSRSHVWKRMATTVVSPRGRFSFRAHPRHSGRLRAISAPGRPVAIAARPQVGARRVTPVEVAATLHTNSRNRNVLAGYAFQVDGKLLPGRAGRAVALQGHSRSGWATLARARTGARGGFAVRYAPGASGIARHLRVVFRGDRANARSTGPAGAMTVYTQSVASWYQDGGSTACGFHAGLGVANRSLPCGTKVRFRYAGRTATATVDDRGPFVGGREWDLNQNTAAALGFAGVGTVWSSS
ncbi:MAG: septal ring lytic transglycosylase RlpA family protein [Solirubrobacteraceae bacterium]